MPVIPALRTQRQVGLCEFEASLGYRVSSRTRFTDKLCLEKQNRKQKKTCKNVSFRTMYFGRL